MSAPLDRAVEIVAPVVQEYSPMGPTTAAVMAICALRDAGFDMTDPDQKASPSASPDLDREKFHACLHCGWRGRRYERGPWLGAGPEKRCPECLEPVWEETTGITTAADDAGAEGPPLTFDPEEKATRTEIASFDGPSAEGRIARMAREAGIEAPIRPDSENEVSSPRSDDDVSAEGPFSGPDAEVRALHGFLQHIAAAVGLGPDIESYDDVCNAVDALVAAPSAETTALHLLKRRPSSTAPVEYREAWEGQVRRFLASDADTAAPKETP